MRELFTNSNKKKEYEEFYFAQNQKQLVFDFSI